MEMDPIARPDHFMTAIVCDWKESNVKNRTVTQTVFLSYTNQIIPDFYNWFVSNVLDTYISTNIDNMFIQLYKFISII